MSGRKFLLFWVILAGAALALAAMRPIYGDGTSRITKEGLKSALGRPDVLVLDVRTESSWAASDRKIPGAVRRDAWNIDSWVDGYSREMMVVLYCA